MNISKLKSRIGRYKSGPICISDHLFEQSFAKSLNRFYKAIELMGEDVKLPRYKLVKKPGCKRKMIPVPVYPETDSGEPNPEWKTAQLQIYLHPMGMVFKYDRFKKKLVKD